MSLPQIKRSIDQSTGREKVFRRSKRSLPPGEDSIPILTSPHLHSSLGCATHTSRPGSLWYPKPCVILLTSTLFYLSCKGMNEPHKMQAEGSAAYPSSTYCSTLVNSHANPSVPLYSSFLLVHFLELPDTTMGSFSEPRYHIIRL